MRGWGIWLGLSLVGTAFAADPPGTADVVATATLRGEYLQGQQMIVPILIDNKGTAPQAFPDIGSRPWLVKFVLVRDGKTVERFNTPPATDTGATWGLAPGSHRETLLELPSGGALGAGKYDLTVKLVQGTQEKVLGQKAITIVAPKPAAVSGPYQASVAERSGLQTVWAHEGAAGTQLYVHVADRKEPTKTVAQYYLTDAPAGVVPHLTQAAADRAWSRHVWWQSGDRSLTVVTLDGEGRTASPVRVDVPWPKVQALDASITDNNGWLHVPFWLASSRGSGELKVLSWRPGIIPTFRSVTPLGAAPDRVAATVDTGGNMRLTVQHDGRIDLYTVTTAGPSELPAAGKKLTTPAGATPLWSGFATRSSTPEQPGGLAVYAIDRVTRADGTAGARLRWASLASTDLPVGGEVAMGPDGTLVDALPIGNQGLAVLYRDGQGKTWISTTGGKPNALLVGANATLVQDAAGATWVRSWAPGAAPKTALVASP